MTLLAPEAEAALAFAQHPSELEAHIRACAYSPGVLMGQSYRQCPCSACYHHRLHAFKLINPAPVYVPEYDWPALEAADRASKFWK